MTPSLRPLHVVPVKDAGRKPFFNFSLEKGKGGEASGEIESIASILALVAETIQYEDQPI